MTGKLTPRQERRARTTFPLGTFAAMLTAAFVTLVGVFLGLQPLVILTRAFVSAAVIGLVMSLGVSVVRLANAEHRRREELGRR
ncbi:MAG: hypothetical protein AAFX06_15920 [Planctomycetota bacterium]